MNPSEILARAGAMFVLVFTGTFVVLAAVALVRALIPALANALLFSTLTVGGSAELLAVVYLARAGLGHRPSDAENANYLRAFLALVLVLAVVFAALMISGRITLIA